MWHGGTNFGRHSGMNSGGFMITSYDYGSPLDEFGKPNEPMYTRLANFHKVLNKYKDLILGDDAIVTEVSKDCRIHEFTSAESEESLVFVANESYVIMQVTFSGQSLDISAWSVSIYSKSKSAGALKLLYSTITISTLKDTFEAKYERVASPTNIKQANEVVGLWTDKNVVESATPLEALNITQDKTDYLWLELIHITHVSQVTYSFLGTFAPLTTSQKMASFLSTLTM
jgi:hypothetical protein